MANGQPGNKAWRGLAELTDQGHASDSGRWWPLDVPGQAGAVMGDELGD